MTLAAEADDTELLELVRSGDSGAMAELWSRHYPATLAAARRVSRQPKDAEEFASDAFSGMLHALSRDAGPSASVRGYLLTSVRNQAANRARRASASDVLTDEITDFESTDPVDLDPVAHHAELGLVREAFATLPPRWQMVLWRTAVDHEKNTDLAEELDRSPNAIAALARRARSGFRVAYVRAHASTHGIAPECAPYVPRLVELLPEAETAAAQDVREHVADCPTCARRLADLRIVDADLGGLLLPALLTLGPGIAWVTAGHAATAIGGASGLAGVRGAGQSRRLVLGGVATAVAVAGACSAFALAGTGPSSSPAAAASSVSSSTTSVAGTTTSRHESTRGSGSSRGSSSVASSHSRSTTTAPPVVPSTTGSSTSVRATSTTQATSTSASTSSSAGRASSTSTPVRTSPARGSTSTPPRGRTSSASNSPTGPPTMPLPSRTNPSSTSSPPQPTQTPTTPPPSCLPWLCWWPWAE